MAAEYLERSLGIVAKAVDLKNSGATWVLALSKKDATSDIFYFQHRMSTPSSETVFSHSDQNAPAVTVEHSYVRWDTKTINYSLDNSLGTLPRTRNGHASVYWYFYFP